MTRPRRRARVALITLGCAKNVADSDLLAGQILHEGIEITGEVGIADAVVVNTCAFLVSSERESIDAILSLCEPKRRRPDSRLVVAGCLAQRHGATLLREIPEIDLLVGPGEIHSLAPKLRRLIGGGRDGVPRVGLGGMDRVTDRWDLRVVSQRPHSAFVKISEGCDRICSFCVIPALRGRHRSRRKESIVREVRRLAGGGVREFNLVAQEVTAYGVDLYGRPSLPALLRDLDRIEGVRWIRLLYAHPSTWTEELTECVRDLPSVCRYVDLPIQHVADSVLRRMRRPRFARARRVLDHLRERIPGVSVRTTLLTGHPGETRGNFKELLSFVRNYRFDHLGVFAFSPEEGTAAARQPDQVPAAVRRERRRELMAAQREVSLAANRDRIGRRLTLMIDSVDPRGGWTARHEGQAPDVDGITRLAGSPESSFGPGRFCDAIIRSAGAYDLRARAAMREEKA